MNAKHIAVAGLLAACLSSGTAFGATLGLIDTFEDGTTQNWLINLLGLGNNSNQPVNVASGGPGGVNDNYMLMTSSGNPFAGGRLVALNPAQWAGDYVAAGINTIGMQVNNFGETDLFLRLLFEDPMMGPPENEALTQSVFLPAGSGWQQIYFSIKPGNLIVEEGSAVLALENATILRIFHNEEGEGPDEAEPIAAMLGVDNIEALQVPEPASSVLVATGLLALWQRRRRVHN
jgi:hypothetical protein